MLKILDIMSQLLLDSPYIRLLQALVTDRVSAGDISYYRDLVKPDDGNNFQLLEDGRIDKSYYEARKARFTQRLLSIAEELATILETVAHKESIPVNHLWRQCNFESLRIKALKATSQIIDEGFIGHKGKSHRDNAFSLQYAIAKRVFPKDESLPGSFQIINSYLVEALYLVSLLGMYDLYLLGCCLTKVQGEPAEETVSYNDPVIFDVMLNPSINNVINYISSVDLSKDSPTTGESINSYEDIDGYLNNVFYPFGLLLSEYEKYIIVINKPKGKKMLKTLLSSEKPTHISAVHVNLMDTSDDLIEHIYLKQMAEHGLRSNAEEEPGYNPFGGHIEYGGKQKEEDENFNYDYEGTSEHTDDINQEVEKLSLECEIEFRAFPVFNALKSYELQGSPYNLVKYLRRCIEQEFVKTARSSEGLYSKRQKEQSLVSERTFERYKEEIRDGKKVGPSKKIEELTNDEVEVMSWEKKRNQRHELKGYLSQNQLVSFIVHYLKEKKAIEYSDTSIRNVITILRKAGRIPAKQEGQSFYFGDGKENILNILEMVDQELAKKETGKKSKKN